MPRWVELFAGGGGAALGIRDAGGEAVVCVEWDADACAALRLAGFPGVQADVRDVDWAEVLDGPVDAVWASPPCQAFSTAGKRLGAADERNGWPWTLAAVQAIRPTWFVAENVVGLTLHDGDCDGISDPMACAGCYWLTVVADYKRIFASVQVATLDAVDYGVPQKRKRVFLVAGPHPIRWPEPTHGPPGQLGLFGQLPPWRTIGDTLNLSGDGLLDHGRRGSVSGMDEPSYTLRGSNGSGPELVVEGGNKGRGGRGPLTRGVDEPAPTVDSIPGHVRVIGGGHNPAYPGDKRNYRDLTDEPATVVPASQGNGMFKVVRRLQVPGPLEERPIEVLDDQPSPTICARYGRSVSPGGKAAAGMPFVAVPGSLVPPDEPGPAITGGGSHHYVGPGVPGGQWWKGRRRLTIRECAALQSFPPDHPFQGTKTSQYRQVGNAVPPPLAGAIAARVHAEILRLLEG